jgi:hypothetical protein
MKIIHNNHDALIIGDFLPALWRNYFVRNRVSCTVDATVLPSDRWPYRRSLPLELKESALQSD